MHHFRTFTAAIALAAMTATGAVAESDTSSSDGDAAAAVAAVTAAVVGAMVLDWIFGGLRSSSERRPCSDYPVIRLPDGTLGPSNPDCW